MFVIENLTQENLHPLMSLSLLDTCKLRIVGNDIAKKQSSEHSEMFETLSLFSFLEPNSPRLHQCHLFK